jgi:hypothetical protein
LDDGRFNTLNIRTFEVDWITSIVRFAELSLAFILFFL